VNNKESRVVKSSVIIITIIHFLGAEDIAVATVTVDFQKSYDKF